MVTGDAATLEDLGSKNGTFLRGRAVEGVAPLADGDEGEGAEVSAGDSLGSLKRSSGVRFRRGGRALP